MKTRIESTIDFAVGGNSQAYLSSGWSVQEATHIWAIDSYSTVKLPLPDAPYGFFIEVVWRPALRPPYVVQQSVVIQVNGAFLGSFAMARSGIFAFFCPSVKAAGNDLTIIFHHPNAIKFSQDPRGLSLCFRRLRLLVLEEPMIEASGKTVLHPIASLDPDKMIEDVERATGRQIDEILHSFEVISGNCDLGLALRHINFESMSLLRFAGAAPEVAIKCLETDFSGIGEKIDAAIANNPKREWMISDSINLRFHSGQSSITVEKRVVLDKFRPYVRFLTRKFLEDIEEGKKIFVFSDHKDLECGRGLEDVLPLYLALRRRSKARMLWVCPSPNDPGHKGSVTEILPGLVQARLDVVSPPVLIGGGISLTGWLTILCGAWLLFHSDTSGESAS